MAFARYVPPVALLLTTFILHRLHTPAPWQFIVAAATIIPLAGEITRATNRLARELGPLLGGLLNASAANLTELIFTGLSLAAGLVYLVQATVLGAIISNLLLVLGLAMVVGGSNRSQQAVSATLANTSSSQLLVGLTAILLPSAVQWLGHQWPRGRPAVYVDASIASVLLATYMLSTWYALTQSVRHATQQTPASPSSPSTSTAGGRSDRHRTVIHIARLGVAALAVGWVSEILIRTVPETMQAWHLSPRFIGLIILPLLGNAIENVAAVLAARDGRMTLAYEIAVGSSTQITLFVLPLLVLLGLIMGRPLTFTFPPLELLALTVAILLVTLVYLDHRSNWLEGAQLLATYVVVALVFLALKW